MNDLRYAHGLASDALVHEQHQRGDPVQIARLLALRRVLAQLAHPEETATDAETMGSHEDRVRRYPVGDE